MTFPINSLALFNASDAMCLNRQAARIRHLVLGIYIYVAAAMVYKYNIILYIVQYSVSINCTQRPSLFHMCCDNAVSGFCYSTQQIFEQIFLLYMC